MEIVSGYNADMNVCIKFAQNVVSLVTLVHNALISWRMLSSFSTINVSVSKINSRFIMDFIPSNLILLMKFGPFTIVLNEEILKSALDRLPEIQGTGTNNTNREVPPHHNRPPCQTWKKWPPRSPSGCYPINTSHARINKLFTLMQLTQILQTVNHILLTKSIQIGRDNIVGVCVCVWIDVKCKIKE
jgi:hypothetical protein